jgi:hypothetical protein
MHDDPYAALMSRLQGALPTVLWTRRALFEDEVKRWPSGCVLATHQEAMANAGGPVRWIQTAVVFIYHKPVTDSPDSELNAYVDSVEAALQPQPGEDAGGGQTTLGGAVVRAWLQGPVMTGQEREGYAVVSMHVNMLR